MNLRTPKALRAEEQAPRRRTPKTLRVMGGSCPRVAVSAIINNRCRPSRRLRALNRFSKSLCSFENRALRRAVLFRLRSAFADLAFRCAPGRACAVLRTATSVPPLDRVRQAAGGVNRLRRIFYFNFFEREAISSLTACAAFSAFTAIAFAAASGASPSYGVSYVSCEVRSVTSPAFPENSTLKTAVCRARSNSNR